MSVRIRVHGLPAQSPAGSKARRASVVALAVAGVLASSAAAAQESTSGQENLGEIVVTAQKREQRLQEVPIAISVVSGDQLQARGGFNIEAMTALVPSLTLRKTNVSLNQSLFLRGIGTVTFAIAAQPSVAFVLDGVVLTGAGEAFGDLYDVERVEVLRGPQGTLFGKNASAGVVNVISKRPGTEFGGYVDAGFYEDEEITVKAAIDTPLSDTLRGRTTVSWGNFPGFIDNVSTSAAGGTANGYYRKGIRTLWQFDPSDTLAFTFSADYRESDDPCCAEVIGTRPTGAQAAIVTNALAGTDIGATDEGRKIRTNTEMRSREESYGVALQADVSLGDYTLTSISSWRQWDVTEVREGDFLDIGAAFQGITQTADFGPQELRTWSQELRIASPTGSTFEYVAGLFYSDTDAERYFQRDVTLCSPLAGLPANAPCPTASWVVASGNSDFGATFKSLAAFGDGTWSVSDRFRVIAGLRWTQDDLDYFHTGRRFAIPPGVTGNPPGINVVPPRETAPRTVPLSGSDKSSEVSGRAGAQFDWTDTFMTYATYARGYKGPAYNVFFNMTVDNAAVIEAETANSYEIGFKSTLGDGSTIVNAAVFRADYDNFQTNNFFFIGSTQVTSLQNAGDVRTQGAELEFVSRPNDVLTLSGGVTYTDATIRCFNTPIAAGSPTSNCLGGPAPTGSPQPTAIAGDPLPFAPKWKGNLSAEWQLALAAIDVIPSITAAYQSDQYADIGRRAALANRRIAAYGTIDAALGFATKDGRYRLTLIGRNLTDESYAALLQTGGPAGTVRYIIPRDADRYFGAQLRVNFGGAN